jgi:serine phosphatase RsbU (regulator of sigma subunit)/anti-sigma regulatory factor (Ser/Thr protein kinase)
MSSINIKPLPVRSRSLRLFLKLTTLPAWMSYSISAVNVALSTLILLYVQHAIAVHDGLKHGPAIVALYFVTIAICTIIGGSRAGLLTVVFSLLSTYYFLMPSHGIAIAPSMSNFAVLAIVIMVGTLVVLGMDAYRNNVRLLMRNVELLAVEQSRADQESVLNLIGQAVRTAKNPEQVQAVAVESVGHMLNADRCYLITYNSGRDLAEIGLHWRKDGLSEPRREFRLSEVGLDVDSMNKHGKSIVIEDARTDPSFRFAANVLERRGVRSAIIVPITAQDQLESTLVVAMSRSAREWTRSEVTFVETVASQTRAAVDAAKLHQKEHNIAMRLQAALQPALDLNIPGIDMASFYRAALDEANVGGDFYDAFSLRDNRAVFVVGDVSGKGLAAASQVTAIRYMLRSLLQTMDSIKDAVEQLNAVLIEQHLLPAFATLFIGILDPVDLSLEYVSCGHEPGLLLRRLSGACVEHLAATGPVIGVFEQMVHANREQQFSSGRTQMAPGDALLLYTDGVCDAGIDVRHLFGVEGIAASFASYFDVPRAPDTISASALLDHCMDALDKFAGSVFRDDVCMLCVIASSDYPRLARRSHKKVAPKRLGLFGFGHVSSNAIESDALRKSVLADVLRLATKGKLRITADMDELPPGLPCRAEQVQLDMGENVRKLRYTVRDASAAAGLTSDRSDSLEMAAGEAANNSLIHAWGGVGFVSWDDQGHVQVRIEDTGHGIPFDDLPKATLERGYTTAGTLGQGFWIILQSVKYCWIMTGETGTILVLEQDNAEESPQPLPFSVLI